jgi:FtsP/CotA-like multicopper oxidase with cupredoxin domain
MTNLFPTDTTGLAEAANSETVELADDGEFRLEIRPVRKRLGNDTVRMLGYNGSIPGPTLRVPEGSEIQVDVHNEGDLEATVHWHGLRLENTSDGTHETQQPIPVGGDFSCRVQFPDPGLYWYHPHIREDYGQEMGLYGNVVVVPRDADYWPPVHRELVLTLDDVLIEDGKVAAFSRTETTYAAMGRFGNLLLVAGEPHLDLSAKQGEVIRLYFTNTANTRVFNVAMPGARMKLVGGDSGRVEHEQFVDSVILAPSERVVVDVMFDQPGDYRLEHQTPERAYPLADILVVEEHAEPRLEEAFASLRTNSEFADERARLDDEVEADPDKTLAFVAEMDMEAPSLAAGEQLVYACPMHPEVVSDEQGKCPKCGMKLLPVAAPTGYACPMHPEVTSDQPDRCPKCGMKLVPARLVASGDGHSHDDGHADHQHGDHEHGDHSAHHDHASHEHQDGEHQHEVGGIEWEDDMVDVNRLTTPANTRWKLIDRSDESENHAISWRFRVGDRVKIRLVNEMDSDHPMHHPFHVHGAGRFLILARDGQPEQNLVWKDTVLIRTGETVDILLHVSNPGIWMAHCHIAEHHESGMMFSFHVDP